MDWEKERNQAIKSGEYQTATREGLEKRALAYRDIADQAEKFKKETMRNLRREKKMQDWNFNKKLELIEEGDDEGWWQNFERRIDRKLSSKERERIRRYWEK